MRKHTTAHLGKRINVILKHGDRFVDKLKEDKSQYFIFERRGRVAKEHIRSFSINRGNDSRK